MNEMKHRINRRVLFVPIFIGGLFLFTWGLMLLWNAVLPSAVPAIHPISFWQAMGIFALSKILFGFNSSWGGKRSQWKQRKMEEKWSHMTPEEREQFKENWKQRCGGRWGMRSEKGAQNTAVE